MIVGIQVFAVGVELPKHYASKHWRSVLMLLGPVMTAGWLVSINGYFLVKSRSLIQKIDLRWLSCIDIQNGLPNGLGRGCMLNAN